MEIRILHITTIIVFLLVFIFLIIFFVKSYKKNNMTINDIHTLMMGTSPEDGTSNHNNDDDDDDGGGDDDEKESTFNILSITFSENDSLQKRFSMKFSDKLKIQKSDVIYLDMFDSKN